MLANTSRFLFAVLGVSFAARVAHAQSESASPPETTAVEPGETPGEGRSASKAGGLLEVSLKAGGHFPQVANDLSTNFDAILKIGVGVAANRRLQVFAEAGYTQPTHDVKTTDPRLGAMGTEYQSKLTVRDLSASVGMAYFIKELSSLWLPYAGVAMRFHFLKSEVEGSGAMQPFGRNTETGTQVGGLAFGGVGLHLGPGLLLGELRFDMAPVNQKVTGDANVGALSVLLGYGLLLL